MHPNQSLICMLNLLEIQFIRQFYVRQGIKQSILNGNIHLKLYENKRYHKDMQKER